MPRHPVINRRNVSSLKPRKVSVSDEAMKVLGDLGKRLHVSQGSLADAALLELARMPAEQIVELLAVHGHLTEDERAYVSEVLRNAAEDKDKD